MQTSLFASIARTAIRQAAVPFRAFGSARFYSEKAAEEVKPEETLSEAEIQFNALQEKYAAKDKEAAEMKNNYIRAIADFRNLQETTKREIQKAKDFALQKFAKELIETIDNFGHALNAVKPEILEANKEVKDLYDGVKMTRDIFVKTMSKHGIEEINPIGEPFDPNMHEATFEIPQPDKEPGTVFHVQQSGYVLNSRVLRAAKVGIVKDA
ncbi:hypothetical protein BABINDRAFT_172724 [Babjeviella inositovora NRRL Y-12698]|uniref:GrpE protein homolog n=1 Tax=Babjeviella inositovora NRRL Y-12698 TaxID=984486 RepID=A0A1E3QJ21_9ASCO|nr:uncharacterized protein BABINDRAFT_172724 [Babjeviella inositovora NRRL Y-12698]ODQ77650.1 hypothetical protein BABINDRAFT_172724 [Babjeviella inositovora NRRL Y-12698]